MMLGWEIAGIGLVMVVLHRIAGSKTPIRAVVLSVLVGIAALVAVNLCAGFTQVSIPVSVLSLTVAAILGIPGVIMLLVLQMLL